MIKALMHKFEYVRVHVQGHGGQLSRIQGLVGGRHKAGPILRAVVGNFDVPAQQTHCRRGKLSRQCWVKSAGSKLVLFERMLGVPA